MDRDYNRSQRFQRESSYNEETSDRQNANKKRVFTEEPPSHKRTKRSASPKQTYERLPKEHNQHKDRETRVEVSNASNSEFVKYPERKEGTDRHSLKSEIKSNPEVTQELDSKKYKNNSAQDKYHSERRNDSRHNENVCDLKDIPLPNSNDSNKVFIDIFYHIFYVFPKIDLLFNN
jgi:hypothetical protein